MPSDAVALAMPKYRRKRPGGDINTLLHFAHGAKSQKGLYAFISGSCGLA
eukprot:CAMPEP_0114687672 /NCGR_PEP_ID=MMETSP0191-20121206/62748_1 /TAXON_ID=126664 /ORGANISM="Sorites sp." /LENGTH=49 /DNA_ID=CAMNT_0001974461 /DNA_START=95 /DNA_END=244 /DNA_ORIENTATION=-